MFQTARHTFTYPAFVEYPTLHFGAQNSFILLTGRLPLELVVSMAGVGTQ